MFFYKYFNLSHSTSDHAICWSIRISIQLIFRMECSNGDPNNVLKRLTRQTPIMMNNDLENMNKYSYIKIMCHEMHTDSLLHGDTEREAKRGGEERTHKQTKFIWDCSCVTIRFLSVAVFRLKQSRLEQLVTQTMESRQKQNKSNNNNKNHNMNSNSMTRRTEEKCAAST